MTGLSLYRESNQVLVITVVEMSMRKTGLRCALFMMLFLPWTMLAWGLNDVLDWLSAQTAFGDRPGGVLREESLLLVPQDTLDMFLPWLQTVYHWMSAFAPGLIYWLGYIIWILWGLGAFVLLLLIVTGEWLMVIIPSKLSGKRRARAML